MPAGYSGTPLIKKLGLKTGQRAIFINAPTDYEHTLGPLPHGMDLRKRFSPPFDFVQFFAANRSQLRNRLDKLRDGLTPAGILWISWPKKASGVATDLDGNLVRDMGLKCGLVDVKVCAIDETWSGLKFVRRLRDRR